ncbi:cytochrome C [Ornithobacterium rhinotracheale]|uniref:heme-binding domain-containing protein n=1 Tax=Ornithobacterium rhinotracheale TaxID=28251 RepID=UPI00129C3CA8|nr:heme-binding domain-containing protein [Ornithobacterium rhinotracheale]MRJ11586.1 cytochrome C [Ornithobacterium rhinotracheale]
MKKILVAIVVVLIAIQFIPVDLSNPARVPEDDFFYINEAPAEVQSLVHSACYDCHSNETVYPSYAQFAPINFWLKHHVDEGREELNFSNWARYVMMNKANHKLDECAELVQT